VCLWEAGEGGEVVEEGSQQGPAESIHPPPVVSLPYFSLQSLVYCVGRQHVCIYSMGLSYYMDDFESRISFLTAVIEVARGCYRRCDTFKPKDLRRTGVGYRIGV